MASLAKMCCFGLGATLLFAANEFRTAGWATQPILNLATNGNYRIANLCEGKPTAWSACDWRTWYLYHRYENGNNLSLVQVIEEFGDRAIYSLNNSIDEQYVCFIGKKSQKLGRCRRLLRNDSGDFVLSSDKTLLLFENIVRPKSKIVAGSDPMENYINDLTYNKVSFSFEFSWDGYLADNYISYRSEISD
jgi:hypothetical protein